MATVVASWLPFEILQVPIPHPNIFCSFKRREGRLGHWRRLVKNIGWENQNIGGRRW